MGSLFSIKWVKEIGYACDFFFTTVYKGNIFVTSYLFTCTPILFLKKVCCKSKELAPLVNKLFPFTVDPFSNGDKTILRELQGVGVGDFVREGFCPRGEFVHCRKTEGDFVGDLCPGKFCPYTVFFFFFCFFFRFILSRKK